MFQEAEQTILISSFAIHLLNELLPSVESLMRVNKQHYKLYRKEFVQNVLWKGNVIPPQTDLVWIQNLKINRSDDYSLFKHSPIRYLELNTHDFIAPKFAQTLTALVNHNMIPKNYNGLELCTNLQLLHVTIGYVFCYAQLPSSITDLYLSRIIINCELPTLCLPRLTTLHWDISYPLPIDLSSTLTKLTLGDNCCCAWTYTPSSLTSLTVNGFKCIDQLDNLPSALHELILEDFTLTEALFQLPESLRKLHLLCYGNVAVKLPPNLTELVYGLYFTGSVVMNDSSICYLPSSLTSLVLDQHFQQPIHRFPDSLVSLELYPLTYPYSIPHLPSSLRTLTLSNAILRWMTYLPPNLERFDIGLCDFFPTFPFISAATNVIVSNCQQYAKRHPRMRCDQCIDHENPCI